MYLNNECIQSAHSEPFFETIAFSEGKLTITGSDILWVGQLMNAMNTKVSLSKDLEKHFFEDCVNRSVIYVMDCDSVKF